MRGATAVEFALVAVPALFLMLVTFQVMFITTARIALDVAAQTLAYDASNADQADLPSILSRTNLCANTLLSLIDCNTDKRLCFAIRPIDPSSANQTVVETCDGKVTTFVQAKCCYEIRIEYPVPFAFDFIRAIIAPSLGEAPISIIRSVALVYRA